MTIYYKKEIMAINVNSVYKTVLSILNKEQRGFLNPDEYNNIAKQVQLEILEKLFFDYNRFLNIEKAGRVNETLADIPRKVQEQLDEFYTSSTLTSAVDGNGNATGVYTLPTDLYKIIDVTKSNQTIEVEKIDKNKLPYLKSSPLTTPSTSFPVYYQRATDLVSDPINIGNILMQYILKPADPRWGYTINSNYGVNIYDSLTFVDTGLINNKILATTSANYTTSTSDATNNTYTIAGAHQTSGSGSGATFTLVVAGGAPTTLTVVNPGSGYAVGDTLTFPTSVIGGSANVVYTIQAGDTFNSSTRGSTDFTLHASHESELIVSILAYAGFTVKNPEVFQGAIQLGQGTQITKQQQ